LKIFTGELEIFRIGQKYLHWAGNIYRRTENIYNGLETFTGELKIFTRELKTFTMG
jgi:hypothetical protein